MKLKQRKSSEHNRETVLAVVNPEPQFQTVSAENDSSRSSGIAIKANHPSLVPASQMATELGVPESQIRKMARENRMPHFRIGKYVRFDPVEVREFMRKDTIDSSKEQYA